MMIPIYRDIDRSLTAEQQRLKEAVHGFAKEVLRPASISLDRLGDPAQVIAPHSALWETLRSAYKLGFHTALIPVEYGGMGLTGLSLHIALEELGWGSADFAASLAVAGFPFASLAATGNAELIDELVKPFVADTSAKTVGCWAITEPNHGSDQFMASTPQFYDGAISGDVVARAVGDEYVINGQKSKWISNGTIATDAVVYLTLEPGKGMAGNGVAFVPLNLPGVSKDKPLDKLGQRALNQGAMIFDHVRIPKRYVLVGPDGYEGVLRQTLSLTNAVVGAIFTGVARAAYEEALAYAKTRVQGGKPICEHQLVQKHLFDMFTKVENCRLLSRAAMVYNQATQPPALEYSVAAKVYCTQAAFEVADTALQLFGGYGLSKDFLIEKLFRDARASLIEDGSNDVLTLVGAQEILKAAL
jgi:alkylation response protein AidB-like acyl-CoA dehydrogenase